MKKIIASIFVFSVFSSQLLAENVNCDTRLSKLKPACNFVGKGFKKLKKVSEDNKTINQSYNNIKDKIIK